ncbi:fungal-specific transcription factor domain-containing protein [Aspergillus germanicus]
MSAADRRAPPAAPADTRPYRSKKQQPCDACRRRRIGCIQSPGQLECTLCRHRGNTCTYTSQPRAKKRQSKNDVSGHGSPNSGKQSPPCARNQALPLVALPTHPFQSLVSSNGTDDDEPTSIALKTTLMPGQTCLYSGASSDQDLYLLRHLPFNRENRFGKGNWRVWRLGENPLTGQIYPDALLDAHIGAYDTAHVENIIKPHQNDLLDLYYRFVHPTLPILESRSAFEEALRKGMIPASLLAAVCAAAASFWSHSDTLQGVVPVDRHSLAEFVFSSTGLETRTPTLRTVQALLLYLQLPPMIVREPNHPGYWASTAQLVAIAQDIGLHVDPKGWNILESERKLRRILWWTVYMQDKWLAHWLGRPSHIQAYQFRVMPLTIADFMNEWGVLDGSSPSSTQSFISFFSESYRSELAEWSNRHIFTPGRPQSQDPNCEPKRRERGLSARQTDLNSTSALADNMHLETLVEVLEAMDGRVSNGLWLSYCKGNIAIIVTFMISLLLASIDDATFHFRRNLLLRYQRVLNDLSGKFEFAALPSLQLNLMLRNLFEPPAQAGDAETSRI